jgi:RNA polymerase sigma-70 factor, ECF subfamily
MVAQDQLALRELYDRSHRLVFTLMVRMTHSRETAEELTLEVFHDLWVRASQYRAEVGTVLAWVMNQARSRAIDRLRFERRQKRINPYPDEPLLENAATDASEPSNADEQCALLKRALSTLTSGERRAIEAAFFGELTRAEVAARLREPLGTIKTRIRSGLTKLRQALAPGARPP